MDSPVSILTSCRDQVVQAINGASPAFAPISKAIALYNTRANLEEINERGGRIIVVPQAKKGELFTRDGKKRREMLIDVAVQYKYATPSPTEIDPYMVEAEAIADFFEGTSLPNGCVCVKIDHPFILIDEHLYEKNLFTSVLTLTYLGFQ